MFQKNKTQETTENGDGWKAEAPEFALPIGNLTTPVGREAVLSCTVNNLGNYKVNCHYLSRHKTYRVFRSYRQTPPFGAIVFPISRETTAGSSASIGFHTGGTPTASFPPRTQFQIHVRSPDPDRLPSQLLKPGRYPKLQDLN
ncbi:hypothetical protein AAG570_006574 [Ranatra chinensis]|uniref:Uncharacterized protein n=1 Tax=Ranatra chinensis TaxID=642074 RepID=A0ABD0YUG4_9HEMI